MRILFLLKLSINSNVGFNSIKALDWLNAELTLPKEHLESKVTPSNIHSLNYVDQKHVLIDVKFASGIKNINFCFFTHTPICSTVYSVLSRVMSFSIYFIVQV